MKIKMRLQLHGKNILWVFLGVLFIFSFLLRIAFLKSNLFFGPEQGIDFLVIKGIVMFHKLTLIGAKTDVSGIFHGPIYYYISAVPFFLSRGNPLFIAYFLIFINCISIFIIYLLGKEFISKRAGIISAVLFTCSFTTVVYPRWLSTHPLAIPSSTLFFLFLIRFLKGSKWSLFLCAIFFGLLTQSEFLNILFFSFIVISVVAIYFGKFRKQNILYLLFCLLTAAVFSFGSFLLFDIRHNFLITRSILSLVVGKSGYSVSYVGSLNSITHSFISFIGGLLLPQFSLGAFLIFIAAIIGLFVYGKSPGKEKSFVPLLFLWIFVPPLLLLVLHHQVLDQFYVSIIPAILLITGFLLDYIWTQSRISALALLILLVGANLIFWTGNIPANSHIFFQSTQSNLHYSDEKKVIDAIYKEAAGTPFSIQSYTIPYWSQQGWEYLFWQYGLPKYHSLPIAEKAPLLFVIVQDDLGNKGFQRQWLRQTVTKWGNEKKEFRFGALTVKELVITGK